MFKKKLTLLLLVSLCNYTFSQKYFNEKIKDTDIATLINEMNKNREKLSPYDVIRKQLLIPQFSPDLKLFRFKPSLISNQEKYESLIDSAIKESSCKNMEYQIKDIDYTQLSNEERQKFLYITFSQFYITPVLNVLNIWNVNESNEEQLIAIIYLYNLNLTEKENLRYTFNSIRQNLESLDGDSLKKPAEISINKETASISNTKDNAPFHSHDYFYEKRFYDSSKKMTLLVPNKIVTKKLLKTLSNWEFSNYKLVPQSEIDSKIQSNDTNYYYLKSQVIKVPNDLTGRKGFNFSFHSTYYDKELYKSGFISTSKEKNYYIKTLNFLIKKFITLNVKNTIIFGSIKYDYHKFPHDLKSVKIGYLNIDIKEYSRAKLINTSFKKKTKNSDLLLTISDDLDIVNKCKYRIFLKHKRVIKQQTNTNGYPKYITQDLFNIVLKNNKTGETYTLQEEAETYPKAFKKFVEAASEFE